MTCNDCLSEYPCSTSLKEMYKGKAELCPYLKNKADYAEVPKSGIGDLSDGYHTFNELFFM